MLGIPCCHAVACIYFLNKEAEAYVDDCYKREVYLKAYSGSIPAIEGERYWPRVEHPLDPPPIKIEPGRPRVNRIRDPMEDPKKPGTLKRTGIEMTCSVCHIKGHNKRRCPNKDSAPAPSEPQPKRPRGRPRKDGQPPVSHSQVASTDHHNATALPSKLGRGGRMCRGGAGSWGGGGKNIKRQRHKGREDIYRKRKGKKPSTGGQWVVHCIRWQGSRQPRSANEQATPSSQASTVHQGTQPRA
ncbi:uncharacterized protein [Spinacia oleracea]|uniref:SWIM-type domain-containing protein n=1 Tax=Spinacia oleracea TaxID=3562 RepID=A0ABM3R424_SPIOL|nr:uncharacterized protein LOC130465574 [Spinacia oleracea]